MSESRNILVFRIGSLGDTLVGLPAFHLLRRQYPHDPIVLLTNTPADRGIKAAPSHQVLMGSGLIDDYLEYPHGRLTPAAVLTLARRIRSLRPREAVYLMPVRTPLQRARDLALFLAAGVTRVRGITGRSARKHRALGAGRHESEASRLLRSIGFTNALVPELFSVMLREEELAAAEALLRSALEGRRFMALSVGAKVPAKDWGSTRWAELLKLLAKEHGDCALVFVGSLDETQRCAALAMEWPGKTLNLCGRLSPRQSAAVLEHAALFVGHDSGPMHLANSVGTPAVTIFAARTPRGIWFPFGNEDNVIYHDVPCAGCGLSVCTVHDTICLARITPDEVAARIRTILKKPRP